MSIITTTMNKQSRRMLAIFFAAGVLIASPQVVLAGYADPIGGPVSTLRNPLIPTALSSPPFALPNQGAPLIPGSGPVPLPEIPGDTGAPMSPASGVADPTSGNYFPNTIGQDRTIVRIFVNGRMVQTIRPDQLSANDLQQINGILGIDMLDGEQSISAEATGSQMESIQAILAKYPAYSMNGNRKFIQQNPLPVPFGAPQKTNYTPRQQQLGAPQKTNYTPRQQQLGAPQKIDYTPRQQPLGAPQKVNYLPPEKQRMAPQRIDYLPPQKTVESPHKSWYYPRSVAVKDSLYEYQGPLPTVRAFARWLVILGVVAATIFMAIAAYSVCMGHPYGGSRVVGAAGGLILLLMGYTIYKIVMLNTFGGNSVDTFSPSGGVYDVKKTAAFKYNEDTTQERRTKAITRNEDTTVQSRTKQIARNESTAVQSGTKQIARNESTAVQSGTKQIARNESTAVQSGSQQITRNESTAVLDTSRLNQAPSNQIYAPDLPVIPFGGGQSYGRSGLPLFPDGDSH